MNAPVQLSDLQRAPTPREARLPAVTPGFGDLQSFELMQRGAKVLCASTLVPKAYQGSEGLPNAIVALNMALRMKADPLMVMQNLYVVHGRPAWSAQFLIACFNQCGRYSALRYEWQSERGKDDWGCRAWAIEKETGDRVNGPLVTMAIAKAEGWINRDGSKWKTIPELMLTYRAAAWMIRTNAPEIAMGLPSADEVDDVVTLTREEYNVEQVKAGAHATPAPAQQQPTDELVPASGGVDRLGTEGDLAGGFTFAQVAAAIREATTTDALDLAADMIRGVADEQQRAELDVEAKAKRKALAK